MFSGPDARRRLVRAAAARPRRPTSCGPRCASTGVLHVGEVKRAFVEPDGEITIVKRTDHDEAQPLLPRARPPRPRDTLRQ